jgi:hypothetical protein
MSFKNDQTYQRITEAMDKEKRLYPKDLIGLGHRQLKKPRGLAGGTYGAAGPCRTLSEDDVRAIEAELRERGAL